MTALGTTAAPDAYAEAQFRAPAAGGAVRGEAVAESFEALYDAQFAFVWRSLRRLGVAEAGLDDASQDVFLVVHRRLAEFAGRSSPKTWLFAIVLRVASDHRRRHRRKDVPAAQAAEADTVADEGASPHDRAERAQALLLLHALLEELDEEKRAVFLLADLEQMSAPEIAEALSVNVNTVYARLRAARQQFEQALSRHRARDKSFGAVAPTPEPERCGRPGPSDRNKMGLP